MAEEQGNTGERANKRLRALLEGFGWEYKGGEVDISCEARQHDQDEHGIDGYMVYEDPYLADERGVLLESKSKKWESWGPTSLDKDAKQARTALECSTRSEDFEDKLNHRNNRNVDASILGAYTHNEEYDDEQFQSYVESCTVKKGGGGPYHVLILGNKHLSRLASIQSKYEDIRNNHTNGEDILEGELRYYYPPLHVPKGAPRRSDQMSFEYLFSDYIYAKLQKTVKNGNDIENKNISIVFNSGGISKDSLHFLYLSLRDNEILDADEIWIYSYMQTEEEEDTEYETVIDDLKTNLLPDDKKFEFNPLPRVDYKTYADELRER